MHITTYTHCKYILTYQYNNFTENIKQKSKREFTTEKKITNTTMPRTTKENLH